MKIGILGGTFNPVHNGHIMLARRAKVEFDLDKVVFMPAGNPYFKKGVLPIVRRVEILKAALGEEFEISELESDQKRPTYSCDTFEYLHKKYPEDTFYMILGYDCLESVHLWMNPGKLLENCEIIAATREGSSREALEKAAEDLQREFGGRVHLLEFPDIKISSTKIREKIFRGESIEGLVPKEVEGLVVRYEKESGNQSE